MNEIHTFDNSVNMYRSVSGHTFEDRSSEKPAYIGIFIFHQNQIQDHNEIFLIKTCKEDDDYLFQLGKKFPNKFSIS